MARPKSPDGRSVTHAAKFSEAESAAIDAVRGDVRWSEWLRSVALAAAGHCEPAPVVPTAASVPVNRNEPVNQNGDAIEVNRNVAVNQNEAPNARARKPAERCPHPKARVLKGKCWACGETVSKR